MKELFIVSSTSCDNEWAETPDVVVIPLNKVYVQQLLARIEIARKMHEADNAFYCMEYFDYHAEWYKSSEKFEEMLAEGGETFDNEPMVFESLPPDMNAEDDLEDMEVPTILFKPNGVQFQAAINEIPNSYTTSLEINESMLRDALAKLD